MSDMQPVNQTKPPPLSDDQADLMMAVIGIWMAVDVLQQSLPPDQASRVVVAMSNVSASLGRILARHDITISASVVEAGPSHE